MFNTIHELTDNTKVKIQELNYIVDTLLAEYRIGSDIIDGQDHRTKPLEQLRELNQTLSELVNTHPVSKSTGIDLDHQNAEWIKNIAASGKRISGTSFKNT
jgi:hypothetical protein